MSRLEESEFPGHEEIIFPCDCHIGHYLRIAWDNTDTEWRYLWLENAECPNRWRDRIRDACRIVRGRRCAASEIVLSGETVAKLSSFLAGRAARGVE